MFSVFWQSDNVFGSGEFDKNHNIPFITKAILDFEIC